MCYDGLYGTIEALRLTVPLLVYTNRHTVWPMVNGRCTMSACGLLFTGSDNEAASPALAKVAASHHQHHPTGTDFHLILADRWEAAVRAGLFRYKMTHQRTRILPGRYGFVAQFNPARMGENYRRKPQEIKTVNPDFDPKEFNFNKVTSEEIVFCQNDFSYRPHKDDIIVVNASPLEFGHCLFVPEVSQNIPQRATLHGLEMLVNLMLINPNRVFRAGFSSAGGYASVNHQHYHIYYLKEPLPLENAEVEHVAGPCFALTGYPSKGFAFQLDQDPVVLARSVFKLISYLSENQIAHNLFMTWGRNFTGTGEQTLCVFVWAREASFNYPERSDFNTGLCELAGHLILKSSAEFETLQEDTVAKHLEELTGYWFQFVLPRIPDLFSPDDLQGTIARCV